MSTRLVPPLMSLIRPSVDLCTHTKGSRIKAAGFISLTRELLLTVRLASFGRPVGDPKVGPNCVSPLRVQVDWSMGSAASGRTGRGHAPTLRTHSSEFFSASALASSDFFLAQLRA